MSKYINGWKSWKEVFGIVSQNGLTKEDIKAMKWIKDFISKLEKRG